VSFAVGVGDGDDGVVERRLDVGDAPADVAALFAFLALAMILTPYRVNLHSLTPFFQRQSCAAPSAWALVRSLSADRQTAQPQPRQWIDEPIRCSDAPGDAAP
jgi:hypothetical protein